MYVICLGFFCHTVWLLDKKFFIKINCKWTLWSQLYFVFAVKSDITVHQNGEPQSSEPPTETSSGTVVEPNDQTATTQEVSEILDMASEITEVTSSVEQFKKGKESKRRVFGKLFKKKSDRPADDEMVKEKEKQSSNEDQLDVGQVLPDPQKVRNILIKSFFLTNTVKDP